MSVTFSRLPQDVRTAPECTTAPNSHETPAYFANDLTQNGQTAFICLHDQVYTLRITRAGKLILTK